MDLKWYIVHTKSGCEFKAKEYIEKKIAEKGITEITEVMVPTYSEDVYRNGKPRKVVRKSFPGYILVKMVVNKSTMLEIQNTPTISSFVAHGKEQPRPLTHHEFQAIVKTDSKDSGNAAPLVNIDFDIGEKVLIIDGPFNNFQGTIKGIFPDKKKVSVNVEIFGRTTPVEIDYFKVKKS
ncbi:MAG: transcription termination/antitermination factor NusG [Spirochaetes bacterium GWF1_41_5]|nr:MAG: transcription termination/antitermination factor NusG [Spirochaetes bacterium GWF1_41_5]HBE01057.1 transcription termination/antitermination factor NusG [Spirochaetia bacterium]